MGGSTIHVYCSCCQVSSIEKACTGIYMLTYYKPRMAIKKVIPNFEFIKTLHIIHRVHYIFVVILSDQSSIENVMTNICIHFVFLDSGIHRLTSRIKLRMVLPMVPLRKTMELTRSRKEATP